MLFLLKRGKIQLQISRIAVFAAICVGLMLPGSNQPANAETNDLVVTGFQAPPYLYSGEDGQAAGLLVDLLQNASKTSGVGVEFVVTNWPRAQLATQQGRADLIFPVVHTPEREEWLAYPQEPIVQFEMAIFARKDSGLAFTGKAAELHGLTIGKIAKGRMHPNFRALEESGKAKIEQRDTVVQLLMATHHGRIDAFVAPRIMTLWTADRIGMKTVAPFEDPIGVADIYLAFSKESSKEAMWDRLCQNLPSLNSKIDLFLASLQQ